MEQGSKTEDQTRRYFMFWKGIGEMGSHTVTHVGLSITVTLNFQQSCCLNVQMLELQVWAIIPSLQNFFMDGSFHKKVGKD